MEHDKGTPSTLAAAIENGLEEFRKVGRPGTEVYFIQMHVKDFLAQHFSAGTLNAESSDLMLKLFERITRK